MKKRFPRQKGWRRVPRVYRRPLACPSVLLLLLVSPVGAQQEPEAEAEPRAALEAPAGAQRLDPEAPLWVDVDRGRVYADGHVTLRKGVLEMFACPEGTKEHESILAVESKAMLLHTALLAIGAKPGKPVQFDPEYRPPRGDRIEVRVEWIDRQGKSRTARAQDWIRHTETGKAMDLPFVFAGSAYWTDPDTGRQHYLAESGDLICVSNFGSAMLDVPAPSSQANDALWFEPFTERIPPVGAPVRMILSVMKEQALNED